MKKVSLTLILIFLFPITSNAASAWVKEIKPDSVMSGRLKLTVETSANNKWSKKATLSVACFNANGNETITVSEEVSLYGGTNETQIHIRTSQENCERAEAWFGRRKNPYDPAIVQNQKFNIRTGRIMNHIEGNRYLDPSNNKIYLCPPEKYNVRTVRAACNEQQK